MTHISSIPNQTNQLDSGDPRAGGSVVVTIDGPAGAGKSTVAKLLADHLGFDFLDTGALYRCVTLAVLRAGISVTDDRAIAELAQRVTIVLIDDRVLLDGKDVSRDIRTPKVAAAIGLIADNIAVRQLLTRFQREWTLGKNVVTEGRDQGSDVFPDSPCKIFLIASSEVRARRRMADLNERGIEMSYEAVFRQQEKRDQEDRDRPVGSLRMPHDALEVCTDGMSLENVVKKLVDIAKSRIEHLIAEGTSGPSKPVATDDSGLTQNSESQ